MAIGVLEGRTALITGGSRGIGRAIALAFAREGADVAINHHPPADAVHPSAADEVAHEIRSMGRRARVVAADVAREEPVKAMVDQVLNDFGRVDILVNN